MIQKAGAGIAALTVALVFVAACSSGSSSKASTPSSTVTSTAANSAPSATAPGKPKPADLQRLAAYVSWCSKLQALASSHEATTVAATLQPDTIALLRQDPLGAPTAVINLINAPYAAAAVLVDWRDYCPATRVAKAAAAVAAAKASP